MTSREEEESLREETLKEINSNKKDSYAIYKYLTIDKLQNLDDVSVKPWSVDFKKDTQPRLQRHGEIFKAGHLTKEVYSIWDYELGQAVEEICKVETVYYKLQDEEYETAKLPYLKVIQIQFKLADGTYKLWTPEEIQAAIDDPINSNITDIKIEKKAYPDFFTQNEVAEVARKNVQGLAARDLVLLISYFVTGGDRAKAKDIGIALVRKYSDSYGDFAKYGDRGWVIDIENETTTDDVEDKEGEVILAGVSFNSMLETIVPDTVVPNPFNPEQLVHIDLIVPQAKGLTLREFLIKKFRGEIHA